MSESAPGRKPKPHIPVQKVARPVSFIISTGRGSTTGANKAKINSHIATHTHRRRQQQQQQQQQNEQQQAQPPTFSKIETQVQVSSVSGISRTEMEKYYRD
jgi:hypothetical protein